MTEKQQGLATVALAWFVCMLASLFYSYEFFLRVAPSVMVPNLMAAYGVTASGFALMSAAYYYIYTPMQLPVGILMDRYGPRRLLSLAILLCAIGSFLIAGVLNLYVASFARILMGFGSAFAFVGVLKLAAHWLPPSRLALMSGIATTLGMLGAIGGDTILNSLVYTIGWREAWVIAGVMGIVLSILMWVVVRDNPVHKRHLMKRETRTWGQAWKYMLSISTNTQFWINGLIGGLLFLPLTVFGALWGIPFLEEAYGLSHISAGTALSVLFVGVAISSPFVGWFSSYIKRRRIILMVGALCSAISFSLLLFTPHLSEVSIYVLMFLGGIFTGCEVIVFAIGCEISSPKAAGTAIAGTNFLVMIGGAIFQPVAGKLLDMYWTHKVFHGVRFYTYHDFQIALSVLPIGLFIAFLLSFFMKETYCKQQVVDIHHRDSPAHSKSHLMNFKSGDLNETEITAGT